MSGQKKTPFPFVLEELEPIRPTVKRAFGFTYVYLDGKLLCGLREAVKLLDGFHADFEYEGEMAPDVALNIDLQRRFYPFSRLTGPANILVMPGLQSASISAKLLKELGGDSVLGPYLLGLQMPVQIAPMTASASDLVMLAVLAAGDAHARQQRQAARVRAAK